MMRSHSLAVFAAVAITVFGTASRAETVAGAADFERALKLHAGDPSGKAAGKALPLYKKGCLAGFAPACTEWGHLRYFADGVPMDLPEAGQAYDKGCAAGAVRSCVMLARMKQKGIGYEVDRSAASDLLDRACEVGGPSACKYVAQLLSAGVWLSADIGRAKDFEARACKDGGCRRRDRDRDEARAKADELKAACGSGDNEACLTGGQLLLEYGGGDVDALVSQMFELACKGGLGEACYARVTQSESRRFEKLEPDRRMELLKKACDLSVASACASLGFSFASRYASMENVSHAVAYLRRGCVLGDSNACTRLGDYLQRVGPKNVSIMPIYERACEFETGGGGCNVVRVADGFQDGERYMWTCKNVSREACVKAGLLYATGQGVRQIGTYFDLATDGVREDPVLALAAFQTGCDKEDAHSCGQLAMLHYEGKGAKKDEARAVKLWSKSCEAGDGMSCYVLGELSTRGLAGVPQDRTAGLGYYEKGCELGWGAGCLESAWAYRFADGVPEDVSKAIDLFEKGCKAGNSDCCHDVRSLKDDMAQRSKTESECPESISSCVFAADDYAAGERGGRDVQRAAMLYEKACTNPPRESFERDYGREACVLAALYATSVSDAERQKLFQRACEKESEDATWAGEARKSRFGCTATSCMGGDGKACIQFGVALSSTGRGWPDAVVLDRSGAHREVALEWIEKGCALGAKECAQALEEFRKSALAGRQRDGTAAFSRRILPKIRKALEARCEAGDAQTCFSLGDMLKNGHGGSADAGGARDLVKKACELGYSDACIAARGMP